MSEMRGVYVVARDLKRAIVVYNRSRELMQQLYALREHERPPVTGAEMLEIVKAATRMPRERFNELLESLLAEIESTGREITKRRRLMVIGGELQNSTWIGAAEDLDAVVVTDELCTGTRYCFGSVDTKLPPLEALARYYLQARVPGPGAWSPGERFTHIFEMADRYKVDGVIARIQHGDAEHTRDRMRLQKEMEARGIPMLELDVEYCDGRSAQLAARFEAFVGALQGRAAAPVKRAPTRRRVDSGSSPRTVH